MKKGKVEKKKKKKKKSKKDKYSKFDKASKYDKKGTDSKGDILEKGMDCEGEDSVYYSENFDDDTFDDDYCFLGEFPSMYGANVCVANFAEKTCLDIHIDNALNCTESIEKIASKKYPPCYKLEYYTPEICDEFFQSVDELAGCMIDLFYENLDDAWWWFDDDYSHDDYYFHDDDGDWYNDDDYCDFDAFPELGGCVINFADAFDLESGSFLDCSVDIWSEYSGKCYSDDYLDNMEVCETYDQCYTVLSQVGFCVSENLYGDVPDIVSIFEVELGLNGFLDTIYNGTVDLEYAVAKLGNYTGWNSTSEWTDFVDCTNSSINWLFDSYCYLDEVPEMIGGCINHFAEDFDDLDTDELLNCTVDFWSTLEERCYDESWNWNTTNSEVCQTYYQCETIVYSTDYCIKYFFEGDVSELVSILEDELGFDVIFTVNLEDAVTALKTYNGTSEWLQFTDCMDNEIYWYNYDDV